ncbi:MAG: hypothetical protein PHH84_06825 [Oscillospiraceae bacterium]|nr:hypothetical protein [Oscillospiraceae bacterium]MDD4414481.1 hypothetical protein [Oscillospiraceae bacterium]
MSKEKRIGSRIFVVSMIVMIVGSIGIMSVSANNHANTNFTYNWQYGPDSTWNDATPVRAKTDTSSAMMACTSGPNYNARVYGVNIKTGNYQDKSRGHVYAFTANSSTYMLSWVYEDGWRYASIVGVATTSNHTTPAKGFWSPDSI